ncbi:unnamed protein product [Symbiodinium natans]|uniref:Uncharacterized protein n=1 Tax=Symbiodinium natans TaxID=878477 RepID=A0A812MW09_9DINO|nr:unnamed protein product [Symbiodinium natans]
MPPFACKAHELCPAKPRALSTLAQIVLCLEALSFPTFPDAFFFPQSARVPFGLTIWQPVGDGRCLPDLLRYWPEGSADIGCQGCKGTCPLKSLEGEAQVETPACANGELIRCAARCVLAGGGHEATDRHSAAHGASDAGAMALKLLVSIRPPKTAR